MSHGSFAYYLVARSGRLIRMQYRTRYIWKHVSRASYIFSGIGHPPHGVVVCRGRSLPYKGVVLAIRFCVMLFIVSLNELR